MPKTIRAKFRKGMIEPLEPVDLSEGQEIEVTLEDKVQPTEDRFEEAIGACKGLLDFDAFLEEIYTDREKTAHSEVSFDD